MAPPDNPCLFPGLGAAEVIEFGDPEAVPFGKIFPMELVMGNLTPTQRVSVLENTQHESVEFGELAEQ
jgi:hypothetical protein